MKTLHPKEIRIGFGGRPRASFGAVYVVIIVVILLFIAIAYWHGKQQEDQRQ